MAYITINSEKCKGCYFCMKFCAHNLIEVSKEHNGLGYFPAEFPESSQEKCTGCKNCAIMCPDIAIEVYK